MLYTYFEFAGLLVLTFALTLMTGLASASVWVSINNEIKGFESIIKIIFQVFLASFLMVMVTYVLEAAEAATWAMIVIYGAHVVIVGYMMTLRFKSNTIKQILVAVGVAAYSVMLFITGYTIVLPATIIGLGIVGIVMGCFQLVQKVKNRNLGKIEKIKAT